MYPPLGLSPQKKPTHPFLDATWNQTYRTKRKKNMFLRTCFSVAIYLVMYSNVTGSSTVSLWLWHSTRARFTRILASAVKPDKKWRKILKEGQIVDFFRNTPLPAKAMTTWSSSEQIFLTVLGSWSLATAFLSTPRTTMFLPRTPTYKIVLYQSSDSQKINKRREVVRHNENTDEEVFYIQQWNPSLRLLERIPLGKDVHQVKI